MGWLNSENIHWYKAELESQVLYLYAINSLVLPIQVLPPVSLYFPELIRHNVTTQQTRHLNLHEHKQKTFVLPTHHLKRPTHQIFPHNKTIIQKFLSIYHLPEVLKNKSQQLLKNQLTLWL